MYSTILLLNYTIYSKCVISRKQVVTMVEGGHYWGCFIVNLIFKIYFLNLLLYESYIFNVSCEGHNIKLLFFYRLLGL